jgi:hypothetical protein
MAHAWSWVREDSSLGGQSRPCRIRLPRRQRRANRVSGLREEPQRAPPRRSRGCRADAPPQVRQVSCTVREWPQSADLGGRCRSARRRRKSEARGAEEDFVSEERRFIDDTSAVDVRAVDGGEITKLPAVRAAGQQRVPTRHIVRTQSQLRERPSKTSSRVGRTRSGVRALHQASVTRAAHRDAHCVALIAKIGAKYPSLRLLPPQRLAPTSSNLTTCESETL